MVGLATARRISTGNHGLSCPHHLRPSVYHSIRGNVGVLGAPTYRKFSGECSWNPRADARGVPLSDLAAPRAAGLVAAARPARSGRESEGVAMRDDTIATWFAPHGPIARLLPGYATRPGQIDLAEGLTEALARHQPFLGEAGPGIGKSIAYLLAVLHSGQRAVVATHTKALQDQLYHKDLPLVERLIPGISTALLKGRQNYLCLLEFDHLQDEAEAATGDLGALDVTLPDDLRRQVTVDSRDCLGRTCGFFERCYSQQAKAKAQEADLVVVNHALLLFDLVLGEQTAGGASLLPPAPVLVIDEAHHLPDVATEVFGAELTGGRWRAIESRLDRLEKPLLLTLAQA